MARFKLLSGGLFIWLMLAPALLAQTATRYDMPSLTTTPAQVPVGSLPQLLAVTNATIAVCGFPATMSGGVCTNTITTYTDSTEATACPATAQLVPAGTIICVSTTGLQGAFGFWYDSVTNPHVTWTVKTKYGNFGPYDIKGPIGSGGGGGGSPASPNLSCQLNNSGAFGGSNVCTINPTASTVSLGQTVLPSTAPANTVGIGIPISAVESQNVKAYGAKGDARLCLDLSTTATTTTANSASCAFTAADTGKVIQLNMGSLAVWAAVYTSGGTVSGVPGSVCSVTTFNGGGFSAAGFVYLSKTVPNSIDASSVIYMSGFGSAFTSSPTTAVLSNGTGQTGAANATCSGTIALTSSTFALPVTTTATFVNSTTITLGVAATNSVTSGRAAIGTDDTAAIQGAINCAEGLTNACPGGVTGPGNGSAYLPTGYYLTTGPLNITLPIKFYGDGSFPVYGATGSSGSSPNGDIFPNSPPFLSGSTIVPTLPGGTAIADSVTGASVTFTDFGILFAPAIAFLNTGHGINSTATVSSNYGQLEGTWTNVRVWGQDGNHYGFLLNNTAYWNGISLSAYGGGGIDLHGNAGMCCPGNAEITASYFETATSGLNVPGSIVFDGGAMNLIALVRGQANMYPIGLNAPNSILLQWPIPPLIPALTAPLYAPAAQQVVNVQEDLEAGQPVINPGQYTAIGGAFTLFPEVTVGAGRGTNESGTLTFTGTAANLPSNFMGLGLWGNNNIETIWGNDSVGIDTGTIQPASTFQVNGTASSINSIVGIGGSGTGWSLIGPYMNLATWSQNIGNTNGNGWTSTNSTVVLNTTDLLAPDGSQNATKLTDTTISPNTSYLRDVNGLTATMGNTYSISFWARSVLATDTVQLFVQGAFVGPFIGIPIKNSWQQFCFTEVAGSTNLTVTAQFSANYGNTIYLWGVSVVPGAECSPAWPTQGSPISTAISTVQTSSLIANTFTSGLLYSVAGTALPTCNAGSLGLHATVSDATSPTYLGTYTGSGAVTADVLCNGTNWVTH